MKGLDKEMKTLLELQFSLERIISVFTDYVTDNYDRLRKEVIKELAEEYNME